MGGNGGLNEIKHLDNLELSLEYLEEVEGDENHEVIVTHEAGTSYVEFGAVAYEHSNPNQEVTQGGDTGDANTRGFIVTYDAADTHGNFTDTDPRGAGGRRDCPADHPQWREHHSSGLEPGL